MELNLNLEITSIVFISNKLKSFGLYFFNSTLIILIHNSDLNLFKF